VRPHKRKTPDRDLRRSNIGGATGDSLSLRRMNRAAQQLGRLGGKANTPAQNAARRENGKLGGRPKTKRVVRRANTELRRGSEPKA